MYVQGNLNDGCDAGGAHQEQTVDKEIDYKAAGVNAACGLYGIAGGGGTPYKRVGKPSGEASYSTQEWERFDRGAVAIQILNLAMKEEITHRYDTVMLSCKKTGTDDELHKWLAPPRSCREAKGKTVVLCKVGKGGTGEKLRDKMQELSIQQRVEVERMKLLAVSDIEEGLCGAWDRRTAKGWEDKKAMRAGSSWDRDRRTAAALVLLLQAHGGAGGKSSEQVLEEALQLVESAGEAEGRMVDA